MSKRTVAESSRHQLQIRAKGQLHTVLGAAAGAATAAAALRAAAAFFFASFFFRLRVAVREEATDSVSVPDSVSKPRCVSESTSEKASI